MSSALAVGAVATDTLSIMAPAPATASTRPKSPVWVRVDIMGVPPVVWRARQWSYSHGTRLCQLNATEELHKVTRRYRPRNHEPHRTAHLSARDTRPRADCP